MKNKILSLFALTVLMLSSFSVIAQDSNGVTADVDGYKSITHYSQGQIASFKMPVSNDISYMTVEWANTNCQAYYLWNLDSQVRKDFTIDGCKLAPRVSKLDYVQTVPNKNRAISIRTAVALVKSNSSYSCNDGSRYEVSQVGGSRSNEISLLKVNEKISDRYNDRTKRAVKREISRQNAEGHQMKDYLCALWSVENSQ